MKNTNGFGVAALVLGILGLVLSCVIVGIAPAIIGLVFGITGLLQKGKPKGTSIAGTVCSAIGILVFIIVIATGSSLLGGDNPDKVEQKGEVSQSDNKANDNEDGGGEEEKSNVFHVGDIVETKDLQITFVSAGKYESDNMFLQPNDGYEYWEFEFKFENISKSDQSVSSMMDWECYADNSKVDQSWIGGDNGLDATLSSGRTTQGAVYFEVPVDAETIELEYDINFWKDDKIVFVGK